jgi:hypothetical protein
MIDRCILVLFELSTRCSFWSSIASPAGRRFHSRPIGVSIHLHSDTPSDDRTRRTTTIDTKSSPPSSPLAACYTFCLQRRSQDAANGLGFRGDECGIRVLPVYLALFGARRPRLMRFFLRYTVYTTTYIGVLDFTIMFSFRVRSIDPAKGLFLEQFIKFSPLCRPEHQIERSQR